MLVISLAICLYYSMLFVNLYVHILYWVELKEIVVFIDQIYLKFVNFVCSQNNIILFFTSIWGHLLYYSGIFSLIFYCFMALLTICLLICYHVKTKYQIPLPTMALLLIRWTFKILVLPHTSSFPSRHL